MGPCKKLEPPSWVVSTSVAVKSTLDFLLIRGDPLFVTLLPYAVLVGESPSSMTPKACTDYSSLVRGETTQGSVSGFSNWDDR